MVKIFAPILVQGKSEKKNKGIVLKSKSQNKRKVKS
jgi:hypothetical protein